MKKFFALVLALVMALSLVACGDKKDDSGDVTAEHTDTTTVAVGAVILARDDVSSDDVYKFVADIFDNAASLTTSHAKYGELSLEYGASITSVPYHPGAAKYFAEKGFEVAAVKDGAGETDSRNLRFVTGGESGTYYAFGSVIAQHATNNAGINVVGLVGNGSQGNVQELVDGTADFAFCQSDVMAYAYNGTNLFKSKMEGFSTVAALYMEQVQIVTTNPAIKTVADLAGKSVSIGAPGSGVYFNAIDVLGAYGLTEDDIKPTYQSFSDSADALKNGQIDAAFIVAGAPTTAVTDLATTKDTYLVNDLPHGLPRRFGHILVSCILPNIQIFQFCLKDAVGHRRTQFHNSIPFQNRFLICPDHHVNMRVRIRIVVSCVPVQCRRWNMKRFRKLILLADEQLAPCCGIVISQAFRVLTVQRIDDCPDVAVVQSKVVHCCVQVRIFLPTEQTVCAMLFCTGARRNVTQIAVFGLKILHM